jgi:pimeloyl-ACP methyl ester carboxylesterase
MTKIPDLVILLPGISGSVLSKDGRELWGTTFGAIGRALLTGAGSIRELAMGADDPNIDDLGDGITAPKLIPDLHIIPGLWKIDGYTKVARRLITDLELRPGSNYFEFPYDWRRDNRVAARRLANFAQDRLQAWQRESGSSEAKLVLVAHSMGGLVARYFLEVLGGWSQTRSLVTAGTPYFGSLNALGFLANGYSKGVGPIRVDLSEVLASFTSVYQLLPTYTCVDVGEAELKSVAALTSVPGVDVNRARAASDFHAEIVDAQAKNAQTELYRAGGYRVFPVVGLEQPTFQSAEIAAGKLTLLRHHKNENLGGDGTVPRISATPVELRGKGQEMFAAECHGSLQNFEAVLVQLIGALTGQHIDFSTYRDRVEPPVKLGLDVDDAYPSETRNEVRVRPNEGQPRLIGLVQDAETERNVSRIDFRRSDDGWQRGYFSLPVGAYRISVSGPRNVSPVTDTFVVVQGGSFPSI